MRNKLFLMLIFMRGTAFGSESLQLSVHAQGLITKYVDLVNQATDYRLRTDTRKIDFSLCLENYQAMVQKGKMTEVELIAELMNHIAKYETKINLYVENGCVDVTQSMVDFSARSQQQDKIRKKNYDKQPVVQKIIRNAAVLLEKKRCAAAQALSRNGLQCVNNSVDHVTLENANRLVEWGLNTAGAGVILAFNKLKKQVENLNKEETKP